MINMGKNKTKKTTPKDLRGQHKKIERQYIEKLSITKIKDDEV